MRRATMGSHITVDAHRVRTGTVENFQRTWFGSSLSDFIPPGDTSRHIRTERMRIKHQEYEATIPLGYCAASPSRTGHDFF
eukprot:scaffold41335_cov221-Amphora_coffeaeformis.AAC.2